VGLGFSLATGAWYFTVYFFGILKDILQVTGDIVAKSMTAGICDFFNHSSFSTPSLIQRSFSLYQPWLSDI